ncbi:MAG: DUF3786 domain-containing protein [Deltaproteobacteria bacterium]|jgi:hypothetical protein|nr:DUF3786 domain-containing protein [Deltaproteobacteria bacterium]
MSQAPTRAQDPKASPLWDDILALDYKTICEKSEATLVQEGPSLKLRLNFLQGPFIVNPLERSISSPFQDHSPDYQEQVVLLSYLINAAQGPSPGISGVEIGPFSIPWGDLFFQGPHALPGHLIAKAYGKVPEKLSKIALGYGAKVHHGNGFKLKVLPQVELYFYLEPEDDEFPAEARFNFDSNIIYYLALDGIFALSNIVADFLVNPRTLWAL